MVKELLLSRGYVALVDDIDHKVIGKYKWSAMVTKTGHVYACRGIKIGTNKRKVITLQSVLMSPQPGQNVDHIDHNTLNYQRHNLRLGSSSQNSMNRPKHMGVTSKYKGVHWTHPAEKWRAGIHVNNRHVHLGLFHIEIEAAKAYDIAARKYFGEFAYLNFPGE